MQINKLFSKFQYDIQSLLHSSTRPPFKPLMHLTPSLICLVAKCSAEFKLSTRMNVKVQYAIPIDPPSLSNLEVSPIRRPTMHAQTSRKSTPPATSPRIQTSNTKLPFLQYQHVPPPHSPSPFLPNPTVSFPSPFVRDRTRKSSYTHTSSFPTYDNTIRGPGNSPSIPSWLHPSLTLGLEKPVCTRHETSINHPSFLDSFLCWDHETRSHSASASLALTLTQRGRRTTPQPPLMGVYLL